MKRIFILSPHPVFAQGIETLLSCDATLEVVGLEVNVDLAIERIKRLGPDIVIFDHAAQGCEYASVLSRLLDAKPGIKIIGLNLQDNMLCIYSQEQRVVREPEDLRKAIEEGSGASEFHSNS